MFYNPIPTNRLTREIIEQSFPSNLLLCPYISFVNHKHQLKRTSAIPANHRALIIDIHVTATKGTLVHSLQFFF
jgi:hypothetical protein